MKINGNTVKTPLNPKKLAAYGKSAYEIAVDKGFKGTEEEWLASLKGKDGKDYVITEADKAEIAQSIDSDTKEFENYAESQNMMRTVIEMYDISGSKCSGSGLDIVDGMQTTIKRVANTSYGTLDDGTRIEWGLISFLGIRSTNKNLFNNFVVSSVKSNNSDINYELGDGTIHFTGSNDKATSEYYVQFSQELKAGTYVLSGCPFTSDGSRSRYMYVARNGRNLGTDYGHTHKGITFTAEETGVYFIRCVVPKGVGNVDVMFKPMITREGVDTTTFVPGRVCELRLPEARELAFMQSIDFEAEGIPNTYIVWKDGTESIIYGDAELYGPLEVEQVYFLNMDKKEIENIFYSYSSEPIKIKENSVTYVMTLKNEVDNGFSLYADGVSKDITFTHAIIILPKDTQKQENGSTDGVTRRGVCINLYKEYDTDANGEELTSYKYYPRFSNFVYSEKGTVNVVKAEGNSCSTWTNDM